MYRPRRDKNVEAFLKGQIMNREAEFNREKEACTAQLTHIEKDIKDPELIKINEVYGAADSLSLQYAEKYRRIIFSLSVAGTLLAIAFLLYDEVYWYGMILACGVLVLVLFYINRLARRLQCHKKYLEYRLLAEGTRVQYYLCRAGLRQNVADLLPWAWQFNVPWTKKVLRQLLQDNEGKTGKKEGESNAAGGNSILDLWIRDQAAYHRNALSRTEARILRNDRITRTALVLALITYAAALIFEITAGGLFSGRVLLSAGQMETARVVLKVAMGSFSAMTLFAGNYYGKLSLEDTAQDHRRMAALYEKMEQEILQNGETEELLLKLAREELSENSSWYAYQSKNTPDISI